jgi:NAD(P)H dehydrogenase (quinone)
MRVLLIYCHPVEGSYCSALRDRTLETLQSSGHEVRLIDLYQEGFDPVLSALERERYLSDTSANVRGVQAHVDALRWAEGMIFVYPTWFYGAPAMLKGWLERVWLPGVAFNIALNKGDTARPGMQHIRWLCCVTTSGSPWWWIKLVGDPGRKVFTRGLRALFAPRCKVQWLQLYSMNNINDAARQRFLQQVGRRLASVR